jgi:hypothetical protein
LTQGNDVDPQLAQIYGGMAPVHLNARKHSVKRMNLRLHAHPVLLEMLQ